MFALVFFAFSNVSSICESLNICLFQFSSHWPPLFLPTAKTRSVSAWFQLDHFGIYHWVGSVLSYFGYFGIYHPGCSSSSSSSSSGLIISNQNLGYFGIYHLGSCAVPLFLSLSDTFSDAHCCSIQQLHIWRECRGRLMGWSIGSIRFVTVSSTYMC